MQQATGITKITWVPRVPKGTPARVDHYTGEMFLSQKALKGMPADYIYIVMLHEEGHIVIPTRDEDEADAYSFKRYTELGFNIEDTVKALKALLNNNNPAHHHRIMDQIARYEKYKREHQGNA